MNFTNSKNKDDDDDDDNSNISRENNHIYFYSEIDRNTIFKLIGFIIREAEEYCILNSYKLNVDIPIYLHINSNGGIIQTEE